MRAVVEKELLHYDILSSLEDQGLLDQLTFQGGTSLRLCYGAPRYSEDLDFAGGKDFSSEKADQIRACLENHIGQRYGLEVRVKEPRDLQHDPQYDGVSFDKWQVSVITAPERPDIPQQRTKIKVASIPAWTSEARSLQISYDFLPDGFGDTLILTETLNEIRADKLYWSSCQILFVGKLSKTRCGGFFRLTCGSEPWRKRNSLFFCRKRSMKRLSKQESACFANQATERDHIQHHTDPE